MQSMLCLPSDMWTLVILQEDWFLQCAKIPPDDKFLSTFGRSCGRGIFRNSASSDVTLTRTQLRTKVQFSECFNKGHRSTWDTAAWDSAMTSEGYVHQSAHPCPKTQRRSGCVAYGPPSVGPAWRLQKHDGLFLSPVCLRPVTRQSLCLRQKLLSLSIRLSKPVSVDTAGHVHDNEQVAWVNVPEQHEPLTIDCLLFVQRHGGLQLSVGRLPLTLECPLHQNSLCCQSRNARAGYTGDSRENPLISGTVRYDSDVVRIGGGEGLSRDVPRPTPSCMTGSHFRPGDLRPRRRSPASAPAAPPPAAVYSTRQKLAPRRTTYLWWHCARVARYADVNCALVVGCHSEGDDWATVLQEVLNAKCWPYLIPASVVEGSQLAAYITSERPAGRPLDSTAFSDPPPTLVTSGGYFAWHIIPRKSVRLRPATEMRRCCPGPSAIVQDRRCRNDDQHTLTTQQKIYEKTLQPAGMIPTCENPGATPPGNEPSSPKWEASSLTTTPPHCRRPFCPEASARRELVEQGHKSPARLLRPGMAKDPQLGHGEGGREEVWVAVNIEVLRAEEGEVSTELRRNENGGGGERGDPRENPADQRNRQARSLHAKIRDQPRRESNPVRLGGRLFWLYKEKRAGSECLPPLLLPLPSHKRRESGNAKQIFKQMLSPPPPTKANRIQSPAGSPDFRKWESCRTMPLVGRFSQGSPSTLASVSIAWRMERFRRPSRSPRIVPRSNTSGAGWQRCSQGYSPLSPAREGWVFGEGEGRAY
ncbi:hypothetical protein PR048_015765 [Dryococelus australis]|uniref:Uncharacterized protein n=1 Tax=Dryococelus australis TaxID=614101 RepID=A0ABQ9HI11_9NEOP|nr:hypothetical protein PR048_015765 [Dryococelus australis]